MDTTTIKSKAVLLIEISVVLIESESKWQKKTLANDVYKPYPSGLRSIY